MPKVSIIIPSYNHAVLLGQRINSILSQTYQDFEVILLDDASTDNSREILSQYVHHPKISHTLFNPINSGSPFKQWSKGIKLAKGEYIWIAESDDYADSRLLEVLVEKLNTYPSVGLAYCESWRVDDKNQIYSKASCNHEDVGGTHWKNDYILSGISECANYLALRCTIPNASAVLFRRCYCTDTLLADIQNFNICGDWFFWLNLLLKSDVSFVTTPLNYYRFHDNSVGSNASKDRFKFEVLKVLSKTAQLIDEDLVIYHPIKPSLVSHFSWWTEYIVKGHLNYYFEIEYNKSQILELLNFYKKIISFSFGFETFSVVNLIFLKEILKLMRYKIGLITRIKKMILNVSKISKI